MQSAENARLDYESGQSLVAMAALTDSGDHIEFRSGAATWSNRAGYSPVVRPDGLVTGGVVSPDNASANDKVDVTALTCYLAGVLESVSAGEVTCTRGTGGSDNHIINSIIVTSAAALSVLTGTGSTAFSETRGAAGGPPLITVGAIEIAQVRFISETAAPVLASEIFQVVGTHRERYDYPNFTINYLPGKNNSPNGGSITTDFACPLIHVGPTAKPIYAEYYTPLFSQAQNVEAFVPPETSHSVSSKAIYGKAIAARSASLGQGSFTFYAGDNITDGLVKLKDEVLIFKFWPDENKSPYMLCQGKLGITRAFPADENISAACTISSEVAAVEMES